MSQELRKNLAMNLKVLRESAGLKRENLSLILGFDNSYVSKLEKSRVNITIDKLEKIAEFFNIDAIDLLK